MEGIIKDRYLFFKECQYICSECIDIKEALLKLKAKIVNKDINAIKDNHWALQDLQDHLNERCNFWFDQMQFGSEE